MEVNQEIAMIICVCNRKVPEGKIDREAISDQIGAEKLELQARGLLRDLRRNAYLDIRLGKTPAESPDAKDKDSTDSKDKGSKSSTSAM